MLKYTIKNIMLLINEKRILCLMFICIFISGIMISFSFGIYQNYANERLASNNLLTNLVIGFQDDKENNRYVTKEMLDRCIEQFSDNIKNKVDCFLVIPEIENKLYTECRFSVKDGVFASGEKIKENFLRADWVDTYFSEEQEAKGEPVVLIFDKGGSQNKTPVTDRLLKEGGNGFIWLQGKKYHIIGTQTILTDSVLVPYASLDKKTILGKEGVTIMFRTMFTGEQYKEITGIMEKELGELAVIPPMESVDDIQLKIAVTMTAIAVLITLVISLNFTILYLYILDKRKRQMGIFLVCGLNRGRAVGIYVWECILLSLPAFCLGMLFFHIIIRPFLYPVYHYLDGVYTSKTYLFIFAVYCIVSFTVLSAAVAGHILKKPVRYYL